MGGQPLPSKMWGSFDEVGTFGGDRDDFALFWEGMWITCGHPQSLPLYIIDFS